MRALFVAPYLPTPGSGGRTRLVNFMQRLAHDHELEIVAFCARDQEPSDNPYEGVALPAPPTRPRPSGLPGVVRFYREKALDPLPAFVSWMFDPDFVAALRARCEAFAPDVVHVETTEMAQYLRAVPPGPARALDLQDVASRWFGQARLRGSRQERGLMSLEMRKTKRYEAATARHAEAVFVSSAVDGGFYRGLTGIEPVEVPNGVDTHAFVPMPSVGEEPKTVLFVGPMTYDANLDGMKWFCSEVLPLLLHLDPAVRIDLVGEPAEGVVFPPQVRVLGRVDDVRPHLARCPVSIVPVRIGTGTRYKILEALSMERAVVSTTVGAEGLGVVNGEHLMMADQPADFARAVVQLLDDALMRSTLGAAGRAHVVPRYDWEPLVARVAETWERIARGGPEPHR